MKTANPTFYLRQVDQLAFAFSIATGLILMTGVVTILALSPDRAGPDAMAAAMEAKAAMAAH